MTPQLCSRCGKNPAVVFITKIENNQTKSEGLCLKCARELHIKPIEDIMTRIGISDEDLDSLSGEMMNALSGLEELPADPESGEEDEDGKTATFPFLRNLFGGGNPQQAQPQNQTPQQQTPQKRQKRKFLDNYCI
ncbi:MAG: ATP-dependent Clp protease ATP-binding subunit, partial [Oscillospiraceae bacterium]|nr:ATP-dependent Clp protease ATP-binding subunit [Oscillospiraceae bacterium]